MCDMYVNCKTFLKQILEKTLLIFVLHVKARGVNVIEPYPHKVKNSPEIMRMLKYIFF